MKKRDDFNEMITACRRGEYDLIVTKSVSRFARNLVDCVSLVRELKRRMPPVGVFFETDNLNTLLEESELMLSFLATFAQEESVKKSEAMNWSLKQRFVDGKLLTPELLGYERPKDVTGRYIKYAKLEINEEEAEIVRFIYDAFLTGRPIREIAVLLTDIGIPTKSGYTEWNDGSISYILKNERYCGNVLTWKTFTSDMYEHKHRKNRRDKDQYLYANHHDAIISLEKFEAVQVLMANRKHGFRGGLPLMHVIDSGIFQGYIPINHHWINDDPIQLYEASNSVSKRTSFKRIRKSYFSKIDLDGYQVVRGQLLSYIPERPCISVSGKRLGFNVDCIRKFQNVRYVQLLLHPTERKIAIRPCGKNDVHSIPWRASFDRPITGKSLSCQHFESALYEIMEWNPDYCYRIRGTWISKGTSQIIIFNLEEAQPFTYTQVKKNDSDELARRRINMIPEEWNDEFGLDFYNYGLQNEYYTLELNPEWNAEIKSRPVVGSEQVELLSPEKLEESIEKIRTRIKNHDGE